jgi:hypothetical protein
MPIVLAHGERVARVKPAACTTRPLDFAHPLLHAQHTDRRGGAQASARRKGLVRRSRHVRQLDDARLKVDQRMCLEGFLLGMPSALQTLVSRQQIKINLRVPSESHASSEAAVAAFTVITRTAHPFHSFTWRTHRRGHPGTLRRCGASG